MALDNLISISVTPEEVTSINDAISTIEKVMAGKAVNLTTEQRKNYGRVKYDMEVWVNKVSAYMLSHASLSPSFLDKAEYDKDMSAHAILNPVIDRLQVVLQSMLDTNVLLGSDLYTNSMMYYRNVKIAAKSNATGAAAVFNDLKQQFPGPGNKKPNDSTTK